MTDKGLNPGIVKVVEWLNKCGFETIDSGDGKTHDYGCDRDVPYVVIKVEPRDLVREADRLRELLKVGITLYTAYNPDGEVPYMQASYDPADEIAIIDLTGLDDEMLTAAGVRGKDSKE